MSEVYAALLGALIGALAGLAGGGLASIASLRASQVAARAPLGQILCEFSACVVKLYGASDHSEVETAKRDIELKWNEFAVHQRILCPSKRLSILWELLRSELKRPDMRGEAAIHLFGQMQEKATRMVGANSSHLFRWQARRSEAKVLTKWLAADQSKLLSDSARTRLGELACSGS